MPAIIDNLDALGAGFVATLLLSIYSALLALVIGVILAALSVGPVPFVVWLVKIYVIVFRNTPTTMLFFFAAFVAPELGIRLPYFELAVATLAIGHGALVCEVVRSGVSSVPAGQSEAARAIGLGFGQTLTSIVLPQSIRLVIPPLVNVFISVVRTSAVAGAFGTVELFATALRLAVTDDAYIIFILVAVAICYLAINLPASWLAGYAERKLVFTR